MKAQCLQIGNYLRSQTKQQPVCWKKKHYFFLDKTYFFKGSNNKHPPCRPQEDVKLFFCSSEGRQNSSSFHHSLCFTSGHFQASTGPAASPVPVRHLLGASSEAGLVLRRLDEICMDTEGNRGGGGGRKNLGSFHTAWIPMKPSVLRFISKNFRTDAFPTSSTWVLLNGNL